MKTRLMILILALAGISMAYQPQVKKAAAQNGGGMFILASGWNISSVTSGQPVFVTNLVPKQSGSVIRIGVVLGSTAPLAIYETDGLGHTFTSWLNGGTALTASSLYTFVWEARSTNAPGGPTLNSTAFNFVVGSATTVPILRVTECVSGID